MHWKDHNSEDTVNWNHSKIDMVARALSRGGGGGTQMLFGRGCEAEASKPVPIFKGHFGRKGTHY